MRILHIHIENFGKLHDFDMDLQPGLNNVQADNGWGKSTLGAFVKAMFYGLDYTMKRSLRENERRRYLPWQGGVFGGSMEFAAGQKRYRVERTFGMKDKDDTFALYDLDSGLLSADYSVRLGEELFHLDRAAYERSSYFGQQNLASSLNDSLNAALTHVEEEAGDMQNYKRAAASLEERMRYYQKTGNRGQIGKLTDERRRVLDTLGECRSKERALAGWEAQLAEQEKELKTSERKIKKLEEQCQSVQIYGEKAAKKNQLDYLKEQMESKEQQLLQTTQALDNCGGPPPEEAGMDTCREKLYRLNTLRLQQEDKEKEKKAADDYVKELQKEREELPPPGIVHRVLTGILLAGGLIITIVGTTVIHQPLPGILMLIFGAVLLTLEVKKSRKRREEEQDLDVRIADGQQKLKRINEDYDAWKRDMDAIEGEVCEFLNALPGTDFRELENRWKMLRQNGEEYRMLKQTCELQSREALRSRETYESYRQGFSEKELWELSVLKKPEFELPQLRQAIRQFQSQKELVQREKNRIQSQMQRLKEDAERIPELEEEAERLSQKLAEAEKEYGLLEKTLRYLKEAREQFSIRYLHELQEGLEHYSGLLEPEQSLRLSLDVKLQLKVQERGIYRDLECFSTGWQDLLQIAERLSIVDALYKEEQPVLILDDPFVNLDDRKRARAAEILKTISEKWQVLYFTCRG